jgi:hypothetical protein
MEFNYYLSFVCCRCCCCGCCFSLVLVMVFISNILLISFMLVSQFELCTPVNFLLCLNRIVLPLSGKNRVSYF